MLRLAKLKTIWERMEIRIGSVYNHSMHFPLAGVECGGGDVSLECLPLLVDWSAPEPLHRTYVRTKSTMTCKWWVVVLGPRTAVQRVHAKIETKTKKTGSKHIGKMMKHGKQTYRNTFWHLENSAKDIKRFLKSFLQTVRGLNGGSMGRLDEIRRGHKARQIKQFVTSVIASYSCYTSVILIFIKYYWLYLVYGDLFYNIILIKLYCLWFLYLICFANRNHALHVFNRFDICVLCFQNKISVVFRLLSGDVSAPCMLWTNLDHLYSTRSRKSSAKTCMISHDISHVYGQKVKKQSQ